MTSQTAAPRRKRPPARGDCFEAAGKYILANKEEQPHLVLVHAEVTGQGPIAGIRYAHAWVEDGDLVIDVSNGRDIRMPTIVYYALGNVHGHRPPWEPNWHKYTVMEAVKNVVKHRHWGPWDLKTSSGL